MEIEVHGVLERTGYFYSAGVGGLDGMAQGFDFGAKIICQSGTACDKNRVFLLYVQGLGLCHFIFLWAVVFFCGMCGEKFYEKFHAIIEVL